MEEKSPGSPATANGLGTSEKKDDEEMRDDTERTAAADAAAKEEAFFFWKANLIDQTNPRRHSANPPKEIHRVETLTSRA